jgi:hypothetical protein
MLRFLFHVAAQRLSQRQQGLAAMIAAKANNHPFSSIVKTAASRGGFNTVATVPASGFGRVHY